MAKNWKRAHDKLLTEVRSLKAVNVAIGEDLVHQKEMRDVFRTDLRETSRALRLSIKMLRGAAEVLRAHGKPETATAIFAFADHTEFKEESAWGDGNAKARG